MPIKHNLLLIVLIGLILVILWPVLVHAFLEPEPIPIEPSNPQNIALVAPQEALQAPKLPSPRLLVPKPTIPHSEIEQAILDVLPPVMARVAWAESQFNPSARNPRSTAKGLFQILNGTWSGYGCTGNVFNATDNIACAKKIYEAEGTRPWLSSSANW